MELLLWISSAIALVFILNITISRTSRQCRLPPGPRPLPIVGNMFLIGDKPHRSLARLAKTHGPLISVKLGHVTTVVASSPDTAREVLQTHDQSLCGRSVPDAIQELRVHEASVVWLPAGPHWRSLRKICTTHLFMTQRINDSRDLRREKVRELVGYVRERCLAGEPVDIGRAAFATVMNLISNTAFSVDMVDQNSGSAQGFKDLVRELLEEAGSPNLSDFFPVLAVFDPQGRRGRVASLLTKLFDIFDEMINKRLHLQDKIEEGSNAAGARSKDFLDSLIQCHHDGEINRHGMKCLLTDLFIAGTDTTSHTIEWAMTELLRNPNLMVKVREELIRSINIRKDVDESDIEHLPYLQAVVKETLRLHPPTPFLLPHKAEKSVEIRGYTIPEGTRVLVNVWAIGRDSSIWTDPELFMPERFLGNHVNYKGQDFELIPFGAGRRICLGFPLAFRMVHLMLASLLLPFNWKLPKDMKLVDLDMDEKFGVTLAKAAPLQVIPILNAN